jgi:alanyl-tRNA synthetase
MSKEEISKVEDLVNTLVRDNISSMVTDGLSMEKAKSMGAMALFGEKYGEKVRVVEFGKSVELCGGTHVRATGSIGLVKIVSEGAIAAGIRRLEAVTASKAEEYINEKLNIIEEITSLLKSTSNITENVEKLITENSSLKKSVEKLLAQSASIMLKELEEKAVIINNIRFVSGQLKTDSAEVLKIIAYQVRNASDNTVLVIGSETGEKANLLVMVSDKLIKERNINAVTIIKDIAPEINGGGGGQPFLATAGGKNPQGLQKAISKTADIISKF